MAEVNYEFRKRLNVVHRPDRRDHSLRPHRADAEITQTWRIVVPQAASTYLLALGQDLQDYLLRSMNVSVLLVRTRVKAVLAQTSPQAIVLTTRDRLEALGTPLEKPASFRLVCKKDLIVVCGFDERAVGQGCYYLEDLMNLREAPFLRMEDTCRKPVFQPRMVHSGWGHYQFPDPHLNAMAHAGFDAILVCVDGVNSSPIGHIDLNDIVDRAASFGLDVYLYSLLHSAKHPDDPDAAEYYEQTYGQLFKSCPRAKGVVLVGESCEFPSRDEHTKQRTRRCPVPEGEQPDTRPFPGWWPCRDFPDWLKRVKKHIRKYNPEADIVFWTYNWGWAPEEDRTALIEALPDDISLQATFEMFETIRKGGIATRCVDYTASFEGPGTYFRTEAEVAHKKGLTLYAMANTGGLTWDFGVIPYQPITLQWERRHRALLKANADWGLKGLMESHHYGWWPSVVSELAKWAFWTPKADFERTMHAIARRDFGPAGGPFAVRAWQAWSDASRDYVPTNEDQYGPFRVGPAYPLVFLDRDVELPAAEHARSGNRIVKTLYRSHAPDDVEAEIRLLSRMLERWNQGLEAMREAVELTPAGKRTAACEMQLLGEFIQKCIQTTIHTKEWYLLNQCVQHTDDLLKKKDALDRMIALGRAEIRNAEAAIPLVEADSRLGWEPSMEYVCDAPHIRWKIDQVQHVIDTDIPAFRRDL